MNEAKAPRFRLRCAQPWSPCLFSGPTQWDSQGGGDRAHHTAGLLFIHAEGKLPAWLAPCSSQGSESMPRQVSPAPGLVGGGTLHLAGGRVPWARVNIHGLSVGRLFPGGGGCGHSQRAWARMVPIRFPSTV